MSFQDLNSNRRTQNNTNRNVLASGSKPKNMRLSSSNNCFMANRERIEKIRNQSLLEESVEEDSFNEVAQPPQQQLHPASSKKSKYAKLNHEIVHFQKMVRKLETNLNRDQDNSAENEWRSRILFRSLEDADRDIWLKLQEQEQDMRQSESDAKAWSAHQKLGRDYNRIHECFLSISAKHKFLSEDDIPAPVVWLSPEEVQKKKLAQEREDFFERAMRERESEVNGIHKSMKKVNEIYNELGKLVQNQQEDVDKVEDSIRYARANAECATDHVKKANSGGRDPPPSNVSGDNFHWSMPFETFHEDMKSVQNDLIGLGKDILVGTSKKQASTCVCTGDVVDTSVPIDNASRKTMLRCARKNDVAETSYIPVGKSNRRSMYTA